MGEKTVTIFGTSRAMPGSDVYELAYSIGRELAESGYCIVNGGYGGTMLASARGAACAGGRCIGVTCTAFSSSCANEFITEQVSTDSLDHRLEALIELGQGYIVLPGGTGTLLELAKVWELKNKGFLNSAKPIILVGGFWKQLVDAMASDDPKCVGCVQTAGTAEEVVELLEGN